MKTDRRLLEGILFFPEAISTFIVAVLLVLSLSFLPFPVGAAEPDCSTVVVPPEKDCDPDVPCSFAWQKGKAGESRQAQLIKTAAEQMGQQTRHDIRSSQCIDVIINQFGALNLGSLLSSFIANFINKLASAACAAGSSYINAALSNLCIPMPNLDFNLDISLGSGTMKSCDGVSLTDFIKTRSGNPLQLPTAVPPYSNTLWYRWGPKASISVGP